MAKVRYKSIIVVKKPNYTLWLVHGTALRYHRICPVVPAVSEYVDMTALSVHFRVIGLAYQGLR